jgi:two-component system, OmpR family, phosphate regulon sensor histidine kinase PhoR
LIRPIKQSLIIFLVVLLLPTIVFSIYEIGTLKQNEQIIESIYNNQLDAILFSINQYSEDIISDWASDISMLADNEAVTSDNKYAEKLKEFPGVTGYIQFDKDLQISVSVNELSNLRQFTKEARSWLSERDTLLDRMVSYLNSGYRKIETYTSSQNQIVYALFASSTADSPRFHILAINPVDFISNVLDPKIQEIAQDQFYITAFLTNTDSIVYSSEKQFNPIPITHKKEFWLFNNYSLGIELRDTTINELARSRSKKDLLLIGIVDLILILGIAIIYFNMKKQMELSQLKTDFISNVSHEIRTPLALISMYIETLEMGRVPSREKIQEYYQIILQETQRLSGIVNKILSFSQIENKKRTYSYTLSDINEIVCRVAETYRFSLEKKGFNYTIECKSELPKVEIDGDALADAVVNLIDNAAKYSNNEKDIRIKTGSDKEWIYIEVSDKGLGISENDQKHIFDKFYRVTEKNLALKAKGSGLGLAIVKHIMDSHNGKIVVKSQKGKGSTFSLKFPLK